METKDTYNPYPEKERKEIPSAAWIFTERLKFTNGVNNSVPTEWEQHLAEISFKAGMKKGIWLYAWWKDGVQYVGTTGRTLAEALKEVDDGG